MQQLVITATFNVNNREHKVTKKFCCDGGFNRHHLPSLVETFWKHTLVCFQLRGYSPVEYLNSHVELITRETLHFYAESDSH